MTNEPEHSRQLLQDDHMDQLLTAFYSSERPAKLDQLPSTWPQLQAAGQPQQSPAVQVAAQQHSVHYRPTTARRGLAVAASTLALCLMLLMFSSQSDITPGNGTAGSPGQPAGQTEALPGTEDATFSVSGGERNGAVDDHNTSLKEIDGIELSPAPQPVEE